MGAAFGAEPPIKQVLSSFSLSKISSFLFLHLFLGFDCI